MKGTAIKTINVIFIYTIAIIKFSDTLEIYTPTSEAIKEDMTIRSTITRALLYAIFMQILAVIIDTKIPHIKPRNIFCITYLLELIGKTSFM